MGDEDKSDMKWIVCPSCFRSEPIPEIFDDSDEEDNSAFDYKIHEIRCKTSPLQWLI